MSLFTHILHIIIIIVVVVVAVVVVIIIIIIVIFFSLSSIPVFHVIVHVPVLKLLALYCVILTEIKATSS